MPQRPPETVYAEWSKSSLVSTWLQLSLAMRRRARCWYLSHGWHFSLIFGMTCMLKHSNLRFGLNFSIFEGSALRKACISNAKAFFRQMTLQLNHKASTVSSSAFDWLYSSLPLLRLFQDEGPRRPTIVLGTYMIHTITNARVSEHSLPVTSNHGNEYAPIARPFAGWMCWMLDFISATLMLSSKIICKKIFEGESSDCRI